MEEKRGCLSCRNLNDGAVCDVYGKRIPFVNFGSSCVWFEKGDEKVAPLQPRECKYCGAFAYPAVGDGKGPHAASLNCAECGRHIGWMKRADFEFYEKLTEALQ